MTLKEILELIYNSGLQWDVYTFLHSAFIEDYGKMVDGCRENNAIINAIRKINNYMNEPMEHEVTDEDIVKEYLRFMDVKKVSKIWQIKTSKVKKILRNNGIQE